MSSPRFVFIPEPLLKELPAKYRQENVPYLARERCEELRGELSILETLLDFVQNVAIPALEAGLAAGKKRIYITWHDCTKLVPCAEDVIHYARSALERAHQKIASIKAALDQAVPWKPALN